MYVAGRWWQSGRRCACHTKFALSLKQADCMCRIVLYIPNVADITHFNMYYSRNDDTGMFDTRDSAQNILSAVAAAHHEQLAALPQQLPGGSGTLLDLCTLTDSASDVRATPSFCVVCACVHHALRMLEVLWRRFPALQHMLAHLSCNVRCSTSIQNR